MPENAKTKSRSKLRLTALCGVFAALVFIGTQIRIPTAIGYINLGDGVILIASYFIGPAAFFPGAIGSALSDLIKGLMGLVAALIMTKSHGRKAMGFIVRLIASAAAELIMVAGYFVFEALYYDVAAAAGSVVFNLIQAGAAIIIAIPLTYAIRVKKTV